MTSSREIARKTILNILKENKRSNQEISNIKKSFNLDDRDFFYITKIVYGVIENKIYFDYILKKHISFSKTKLDTVIWFYIFLYEIIYLEKTNSVISNAIVDDAKKYDKWNKDFVNAVLRKLSSSDFSVREDNLNTLRIKNSISESLFKKLTLHFSYNEIEKIIISWKKNKRISFWVNENKISTIDFFNKYKDIYNIELDSEYSKCLWADKKIISSDFLREGLIYIQDIHSMLAVKKMNIKSNSKIWDMCSAPGGKLLRICNYNKDNKKIYATELNKNKEKTLLDNLKKFSCDDINLEFTSALDYKEKEFDYILLDSPCSASGTIYKNPEIKLREFDWDEHKNRIALQKQLLLKACDSIKQNGTIVYSTCSIFEDENRKVVKAILEKRDDIELISEDIWVGTEKYVSGFYIANLIKKK